MILKNDRLILKNDKMGYKEMISPEFSSFKPVPEMKSPDQSSLEETGMGKRPDLLSRVCKDLLDCYITEIIAYLINIAYLIIIVIL